MKKIFKLFSLVLAFVTIVTLAACNSGDVTGTLEVTTTSTKITATASFNKHTKLEESATIVSVKLYDEEVTELLDKKTVDLGDEKVQGTVTFESLDTDETYVLKLYVSYGGNEYFIYETKATTTSSGSSEETPIAISTVDEFLAIEDDRDAYYKLINDLDFTDAAAVSICSSSDPFKGVFDGNGFAIKNYSIAVGEYAGLFEYVEDATIKNLKLENVAIEITSSCKFVGALAGYAVNTDVTDVTADTFKLTTGSGPTTTGQIGGLVGAITSLATSDDDKTTSTVTSSEALNINFDLTQVRPSTNYLFYGGGFAGRISGTTTVTDCQASGVLNCKSRSSSGTAFIGGFAGAIESSQVISACESYVTISMVRYSNTFGRLCIGGFAGSNATGQINLNDCFAVGDIIALGDEGATSTTANLAAKAYIGGIVGLVTSSPKGIKNCYYAKANFGIMVKQADSTQTTNYVDACYVSETVAYTTTTVSSKISNVYSYDSCLNVVGMTTVPAEANTTAYIEVLSEDVKKLFSEAIELRNTLATEMANITLSTYHYTETYAEAKDIEFAETTKLVVLGTSSNVSADGNTLSINPTEAAKCGLRISVVGTNLTLNTFIYVVTSASTAA